MTELGNLSHRIVLPLRRLSTVKIRTGSPFRTSPARFGAAKADFGTYGQIFPKPSTGHAAPSQDVHSPSSFPACAKSSRGCKVNS